MCCADQAAVKTNGMRMFISPIIIIEDFFLFVASGTVREKINKKNLKWTQCSFSCSLCLSPLRLSTCRPCKQNKKEHTYKWFFYHYFGCFFFFHLLLFVGLMLPYTPYVICCAASQCVVAQCTPPRGIFILTYYMFMLSIFSFYFIL